MEENVRQVSEALTVALTAGVVTVLLTQVATFWRELRERRRERDGLLRILFEEVSQNQSLLDSLLVFFRAKQHNPDETARKHLEKSEVHSAAWEAIKCNLAKYLRSREIAIVANYYRNLAYLKEPPLLKQIGDTTITLEHRDEKLVSKIYDRGREDQKAHS